jgi:hypothetical protein
MSRLRSIRIGVIGDTRSLFDPTIPNFFCHVDHSLLGRTYPKFVLY